jgi:CRP/FNR family transcriptional regulator, cyclic AMP receptor protein
MRKVLYLMGILSDTDVQWMADTGRKKVFPAGAVLIQQGAPVEQLYILVDGRLSVEIGNSVQIATLMAGEVIGEISFVDSRAPLASVVAQVPSIVISIEKSILKKKLESDSQFGSRFYHAVALFLADRLRSTTGRLGYKGPKDDTDEIAEDPDELDMDFMQTVSMANVRFDMLIRNIR